jgi:hypothetical protein
MHSGRLRSGPRKQAWQLASRFFAKSIFEYLGQKWSVFFFR